MIGATRILTRADVARLLSLDDCIDAVERAFRAYGEGHVRPPGVLGMHVEGGGFHAKAASLDLPHPYFAAKLNSNFPANRQRFGLPTIQGVLALFDAERGTVLAVMDSIELTLLRTGAATAVAARYLARHDASALAVCGCGSQGSISARAIARVRRLRHIRLWDADAGRAAELAENLAGLAETVEAVDDWHTAARRSDIIATCTTSATPVLGCDDVAAGAFIAAVGADNPGKQEIDAVLMRSAAVVTDITAQCESIGDLHHAIAVGAMTSGDVRAELGHVVAGKAPGRRDDNEVVIFDSTGTALQDVAAAAIVFERAVAASIGTTVMLNGDG